MKRTANYSILRALISLASVFYAGLKLLPVQQKVVFISRLNRAESIDFTLLKQEVLSQFPETKTVVLNHRMNSKVRHAFDVFIEMYHIATSRAVVVDSYVIPVSTLKHRQNLIILQIWHGLGTIKNFGYLTLDRQAGSPRKLAEVMSMHRNYSYVCCGGEAMIPIFAKTFDVDENIVKPLGMPRIDYLLSKAQGNTELPEELLGSKDKKIILYAPTFRKQGKISPKKLIDEIDFEKYALVIKQHTHDKTKIASIKGVVTVGDETNVLDLLPIADYVVTDYSAIAFEAAVLGKPLFFWDYDFEKYESDCGFAMDYHREMPGLISKSAKSIVKAIESDQYDTTAIYNFAQKYISVQDGTSTKQIVDLLCL